MRLAGAEALPFGDGSFSAALSQLVLSSVSEPARAMAEAVRVARPGGTIAACTWEGNGFGAAMAFWRTALALDPAAPDDAHLPFRREELRVGCFALLGRPAGAFTLGARTLAIRGTR